MLADCIISDGAYQRKLKVIKSGPYGPFFNHDLAKVISVGANFPFESWLPVTVPVAVPECEPLIV
jgi:hypothetical protein